MTDALLVGGVLIACFVAYNIGGATTGPAVGAGAVTKATAAALVSVCFFVVAALLVGNVSGAPASTSMTAVGAIVGLGLAANTVNWAVVGKIAIWWLVSPAIGFWVSVMIGRYFYPRIERAFAIDQTEGALLTVERSGALRRLAPAPNTTRREFDQRVPGEVHDQVQTEVEEQVPSEVYSQVSKEVEETLEERVGDQVEETVEEQVEETVEERVEEQVEEQVEKHVEETVEEHLPESEGEADRESNALTGQTT